MAAAAAPIWKKRSPTCCRCLPAFEPAVWSIARVANDYLVTDGRNKYSVPYNLIGERVDIRVTKTTVEVFYHGSRVANHRRLQTRQLDPLVKREHIMPPERQKYLTYNADEFSRRAMSVGPSLSDSSVVIVKPVAQLSVKQRIKLDFYRIMSSAFLIIYMNASVTIVHCFSIGSAK